MKKGLIIIICLLTTIVSKAQIDTTSWYPLQVGNYWEFSNAMGDLRSASTVIGDTLMPNNKVYKIMEQVDLNNPVNISYSFLRLENNAILYSYMLGTETKKIDFTSGLMELWQWMNIYIGLTNYSIGTNDITGITSSRKLFEYFYIDSSFVPPDTSAIMDILERFQRGIGQIMSGPVPLTGAIINGERYGYITDVENSVTKIDKFNLLQNYPNPFNPTTKIEFQIPQNSFVNLTIYNTLGQKVATLINNNLRVGKYSLEFNANNLPSGLYIYKLQAGEFSSVKKMMLIK